MEMTYNCMNLCAKLESINSLKKTQSVELLGDCVGMSSEATLINIIDNNKPCTWQ